MRELRHWTIRAMDIDKPTGKMQTRTRIHSSLLLNSEAAAYHSWANDLETKMGGKKSRFIGNVGVLGRQQATISKATFPLLIMVKEFYRYRRRRIKESHAIHLEEHLLGPVWSVLVILNSVIGVITMSSDGKSPSRIVARLPISGWLRADSVSFKSEYCRLTRLMKYACNLQKTKLLNQVGGKGREKGKLNC